MREIKLIVLFVVLTSFCYIETVNGSWMPLFLGFKYPRSQQRTLDEAKSQNDINETEPTQFPFPSFYVYLRPRFKNHLKHVSKEVNERNDIRTDDFSFMKHDLKNKGNKITKTGDIAKQIKPTAVSHYANMNINIYRLPGLNGVQWLIPKPLVVDIWFQLQKCFKSGDIVEEIEPSAALHYVKTKFMERFPDAQFLKKIFYPLNRISSFRHSNSNFSENQKRPERKRREVEKQTTPLNVHFEILNMNETEVAKPNSSTTNEKGNCSSHFTPDCLLIWSVDWKSLTLSVIVIVILLFFLYILFVCCLYVGSLFLVSYFVLFGLFLFRLRRRKKDVFTQTNTVANPLPV